jgi:hypothetical protein
MRALQVSRHPGPSHEALLMMKMPLKIAGVLLLFLLAASSAMGAQGPLLTELEKSGYLRLASSEEISNFLAELSRRNAAAEKITIATSALGSPIDALLISSEMNRFKRGCPSPGKITVMLLGSQHGTEPSGAEALLILSRDLTEGKLTAYLEDMSFIIIPNGNPDGRDLNRRVNGNGVNLSTNYVILTEPESRGIIDVLHTWKPEVVLDVHESAVLKKKSLGRQGYLTDFEAQFEAANNPNVDSRIRSVSFGRLLPELIEMVSSRGLPARRYIGEITDSNQVITHGGLSLRNLRNMAGMRGSFSFLLENRLDPSSGSYPTPRNLRERVRKQQLCLSAFLSCCRTHCYEIGDISRTVRIGWKNPLGEDQLYLSCSYGADLEKPRITLPLRERGTGERVNHVFRYHGTVECYSPLPLPATYIVSNHQKLIRVLLDRHHIEYEVAEQRADLPVEVQHIMCPQATSIEAVQPHSNCLFTERREQYALHKGDLVISLDQPGQRLIPLLLEPRSSSSVFNAAEYRHLVMGHKDFFIYREISSRNVGQPFRGCKWKVPQGKRVINKRIEIEQHADLSHISLPGEGSGRP